MQSAPSLLSAGSYPYIRDLLTLDTARPPELRVANPELQEIPPPLTDRLPVWRLAITGHPNQAFACYVLNGIEHGFRISFGHATPLSSSAQNMPSARAHPAVITDYITAELAGGRMPGLFPPDQISGVHVNRMGVVPKGHALGNGGS